MYVKAVHADGSTTVTGVEGEVRTGRHFTTSKPDAAKVLDLIDFSAQWVDAGEPTGEWTDGSESGPCWDLRWAWWRNLDGLIDAVITPGAIYILGDNGKTIDRV